MNGALNGPYTSSPTAKKRWHGDIIGSWLQQPAAERGSCSNPLGITQLIKAEEPVTSRFSFLSGHLCANERQVDLKEVLC